MATAIDVIKESLSKKGFRQIEGGNHNKWFFYHNGKRTCAYIVFSRSSKMKDFDDSLLVAAKRELKLKTNGEVRDLWNCPMSQNDFIARLKEYGVLQANE